MGFPYLSNDDEKSNPQLKTIIDIPATNYQSETRNDKGGEKFNNSRFKKETYSNNSDKKFETFIEYEKITEVEFHSKNI